MHEILRKQAVEGPVPAQPQGRSRRRRDPEQWRALIEQQRQSGLSIAAFCHQQGLAATSFYAWRRRLSAATEAGSSNHRSIQAGSFVRLESRDSPALASDTIQVQFACGATLCCGAAQLPELVRLLKDESGEAEAC